jgi:hypothetical protein
MVRHVQAWKRWCERDGTRCTLNVRFKLRCGARRPGELVDLVNVTRLWTSYAQL